MLLWPMLRTGFWFPRGRLEGLDGKVRCGQVNEGFIHSKGDSISTEGDPQTNKPGNSLV